MSYPRVITDVLKIVVIATKQDVTEKAHFPMVRTDCVKKWTRFIFHNYGSSNEEICLLEGCFGWGSSFQKLSLEMLSEIA